jgi:hypothetical protein
MSTSTTWRIRIVVLETSVPIYSVNVYVLLLVLRYFWAIAVDMILRKAPETIIARISISKECMAATVAVRSYWMVEICPEQCY